MKDFERELLGIDHDPRRTNDDRRPESRRYKRYASVSPVLDTLDECADAINGEIDERLDKLETNQRWLMGTLAAQTAVVIGWVFARFFEV